ncbi:MAG: redoxin domain-containing protein [Halovenus sp.]
MIEKGETAPIFTLPGVRDGEITAIHGDEFLGEDIVVLAFYPGDFNPSCADGETGLDELDLFTMQKDVSVLALSGDSVHSHLAFAEEYNLHMPLLSDTDGSVAVEYGVAVDDEMAGYLTQRAVVVVDHAGVVQFTWVGARPGAVPNAEQIRAAIKEIGDEDTAQSRYRVGYARYMEARRAFTSAMKAFETDEWMIAQTDFTQAAAEFDEAGDEFDTAIRFAEAEESRKYFERAEKKAESLWRAADWLGQSSNAFSSGDGARGQSLRSDAESPIETARELHEPPDPDDFPPETDPAEEEDEQPEHFVPLEEDDPDASLDADLDVAVEAQADLASSANETGAEQPVATVPTYGGGERTRSRRESHTTTPGRRPRSYPEESPNRTEQVTDTGTDEDDSEIDDEELEAITAELEQQSESTTKDDEPEINDRSVVPGEITLETPDSGGDELDGALAPRTAVDGEDADTEETVLEEDSPEADDAVADEADSGGVSTDDADIDVASAAPARADGTADDGIAADTVDPSADDEIADDGTESTDRSSESTDDATDSVVDDVYTGVVDVSTDVVTQVGGEFVEGDSEQSEQIDGEQTDGEADGTVEEDVELDLTEPETEEQDDEGEESEGNHGVPDSL